MRTPNFFKAELTHENDIYEAMSIEEEVQQAETSNNPIQQAAPIIYTPRKDGVQPQYDIRADRWDIALDAMDKVSGSYRARRADFIKSQTENKTDKQDEPAA